MTHLKRTLFLASALLLFTAAAFGQKKTAREQTILNVFGRLNLSENPYENLYYWTSSDDFYRPFFINLWGNRKDDPPANGDTIFLCGGTLHDGGYKIAILLDANGKMTVADKDYRFNKGDRVEYRTLGNDALLIFSDVQTKATKDVLKKFDGGLRNRCLDDYRQYILAGSYTRNDGGKVIFAPDKSSVSGFKSTGETSYDFFEEYEAPVSILLFGKKEVYKATKTLTGLELAPMKCYDYSSESEYNGDWTSNDDCYMKIDNTKPKITLTRIAETRSDLPAGRFPLTSKQVMTLTELLEYAGSPNLPNLKIMRNEIFARYGYKFKTKDMADYFGAQSWYKPQYDDVTSKLTEIERINIDLIQVKKKKK
jgi:hypothetical protein